jgi:hypothetical protein
MFEVCGERELKTLLGIRRGDSISAVARRIDENRETIRRVVNRLEEAGFVSYDDGLRVHDDGVREAGIGLLAAAADASPPSIREAYVLPQFAGLNYAFVGIDAVYVWTRGGYQVARDESDYPLFVAVRESDVGEWVRFFDRFGIPAGRERLPADDVDGRIQVVFDPRDRIEPELVDGRPVVPLSETLAFARQHYATFESALDLLGRMYDDVDATADYRRDPANP